MAVDLNCRFTDRTLTLDVHGSGIKLTISRPDLDERGREISQKTSLFLDARNTRVLADVLVGLGFYDEPSPVPASNTLEHAADLLAEAAAAIRAAI